MVKQNRTETDNIRICKEDHLRFKYTMDKGEIQVKKTKIKGMANAAGYCGKSRRGRNCIQNQIGKGEMAFTGSGRKTPYPVRFGYRLPGNKRIVHRKNENGKEAEY